jgi:hypothetical protein
LSQGFRAWGEAVAGAGWRRLELTRFDRRTCEAHVVVHRPWELGMQLQLPVARRWGCPFLQGKLIGLFFHGFGTTVWADEQAADDGSRVEFTLTRSTRTIARELEVLRADRIAVARRELEALVARQEQQIQRLSTPILQVAARRWRCRSSGRSRRPAGPS